MSRAQRDHIDAAQTRAIEALQAAAEALIDVSLALYDASNHLEAGHYEERANIVSSLRERVSAARRTRRKLLARQRSRPKLEVIP